MREISILDIMKYYIKNLEIVLLTTMLSLLFGIFYVERNFIPTYKESTTIILGKSDEKENEEISSSTITLYDSLIHNYIKLLESKKLLSNVKEDLNLNYSIQELSEKIEYSVSDSSQLIEISVTDKDDDLAVEICNQIVIELQNQVYEIYGIKNITIVDEAKANKNQVYTQSFIIMIFTMLGFLISSFLVVVKFIFNNQLTLQNSTQIKEFHHLGKTTNYQLAKSNDFELNLSEKIENDFRMIRSKLLENFENKKIFMVTSISKNSSKSYITYHLAVSLSKINKKVLIMDTNGKDGYISEKFLKDSEGIIDGLSKRKELSEVTKRINQIDIIPLGNKEQIDLLSSSELKDELDKLKQKYDYIFIETPVYKNSFEFLSIFKLSEGILIINNQKQNKINDLQIIIQKAGNKVLGMIFVQEKRKKQQRESKKIRLKKVLKIEKKDKLTKEESNQDYLLKSTSKKEHVLVSKTKKDIFNKNNKMKNNSSDSKKNKSSSNVKKKRSIGVDKNAKNKK